MGPYNGCCGMYLHYNYNHSFSCRLIKLSFLLTLIPRHTEKKAPFCLLWFKDYHPWKFFFYFYKLDVIPDINTLNNNNKRQEPENKTYTPGRLNQNNQRTHEEIFDGLGSDLNIHLNNANQNGMFIKKLYCHEFIITFT
jgi:hypothetical protein